MKKTLLIAALTLSAMAIQAQPQTWQYVTTSNGDCFSITVHGNNEICIHLHKGRFTQLFKGTATFKQQNTYTIVGKEFTAVLMYNDMGVLQYFRFFSTFKSIIANDRKIPFAVDRSDDCDEPLGSTTDIPVL